MTRPQVPPSVAGADLNRALATLGIDIADAVHVIINPQRMLLEYVQRGEDGRKKLTSKDELATVTMVVEITRP